MMKENINKIAEEITQSNEYLEIFIKCGPIPDIIKISSLMKERNLSPYIFIYESYRSLVTGNYNDAHRFLKLAGMFEGIFYKKDSLKDNDYRQSVNFLSYMISQHYKEIPNI